MGIGDISEVKNSKEGLCKKLTEYPDSTAKKKQLKIGKQKEENVMMSPGDPTTQQLKSQKEKEHRERGGENIFQN